MTLLSELHPDVAYPATPTVPESGPHSRARSSIHGALRTWSAGRADCWVGEDRNIYYCHGDNRVVVAPDVIVSFGVDPEALDDAASYCLWEVGAPPAFVLEIASEKTYKTDLDEKPPKYLDMGVAEYWRFDPTGEFLQSALQGDRRTGDRWQPIDIVTTADGALTAHSHALDLTLAAQGQRLRFRDPHSGTWLLDPDDQVAATAAAEARADQQAARADQQTARAERAEAELAALRRRLDEE